MIFMKKLLTILLISTMFAGNLEVEGGITATGEVQSPTIQALLDQIAALQQEIALLQIQMQTSQSNNISEKIVDILFEDTSNEYIVSLQDLFPNDNFDWAIMNIIECNNEMSDNYTCRINNLNDYNGELAVQREGEEYFIQSINDYSLSTFVIMSNTQLIKFSVSNNSVDEPYSFKILVKAGSNE